LRARAIAYTYSRCSMQTMASYVSYHNRSLHFICEVQYDGYDVTPSVGRSANRRIWIISL
jgi:hypothetical protein